MSGFPSPEETRLIDDVLHGASALIVAGPGCGKSRTAIEMAQQKVRSLDKTSRQQVLFLSFSNAAVNRLANSAGVHFTKSEKMHLRFVTFHSCAADLLSRYGRFVGLPCRIVVADKLEERLVAIENGWDANADDYQSNLLSLAKQKGLLAFSVLLPLATALLASCETIRKIVGRRYPLIVVDEFQDTSEEQWSLLQLLGNHSQVIALGDPDQIIYSSLHKATEKRLAEFEVWKGTRANRTLSRNFRCTRSEILTFADCLLKATPHSHKERSAVQFGNYYRNQLRAQLALLWKQIQDKIGGGQTIGILVPSNALVEDIAVGLRNPPSDSVVRFPVYVQMARDEAAYDAVILGLAALRDFYVTRSEATARRAAVALLAMNASWNSRVKLTASHLNSLSDSLMAAQPGDGSELGGLLESVGPGSNLSKSIPALVSTFRNISGFKKSAGRIESHIAITARKIKPPVSQISFFEEMRAGRSAKGLYGYEAFEGKTHVLTFNKAKGREFDYVVMVVDPRHESSRTPLDEQRRLYYVTATRAKKWLGVIHFRNDLGRVLGPVLAPMGRSKSKS